MKVFLNRITLLKKVDGLVGSWLTHLFPALPVSELPPTQVRRVLFIRPGGIGDAVLLIPAIQALRTSYPHAEIMVLAERRNAAVFALCPQVKCTLCYDRWRDWTALFVQHYDLIIDTEQWHYLSAIIARLFRSQWRCGFASNERQKFFSHRAAYAHDLYEVENFRRLLSMVGVEMPEFAGRRFLAVSADLKRSAKALLGDFADKPYTVLFPGASIVERRWSVQSFHALAQHCNAQGLAVVVVGGAEDGDAGEQIVRGQQGINLAGTTTLAETAAVLEGAELLVSGDSGVLHLAVAVGCRTVSLFGPGIIKKWAPRGAHHRVVSLNLPCSPCTRFGTTPKCPDNGRCIQDIPVDMVWSAVTSLLAQE